MFNIDKKEEEILENIKSLQLSPSVLENLVQKHYLENKKIVAVSDILEDKKAQSPVIDSVKDKIRAFVQIQNGCDHRCTFCIIPFGRGNSRSVEYSIIIEQIRNLINKNYKEIVLTGVDLTSYGHDLDDKISLGQLIKKILNDAPELNRLRLSSLDVAEIDPDLFDVIDTNVETALEEFDDSAFTTPIIIDTDLAILIEDDLGEVEFMPLEIYIEESFTDFIESNNLVETFQQELVFEEITEEEFYEELTDVVGAEFESLMAPMPMPNDSMETDSFYMTETEMDRFIENNPEMIEYAKNNNISYKVIEPNKRKFIIKSYAENFTKN